MRVSDDMLAKVDKGKFRPPSDVISTESGFVVRVEIAAMKAKDFKVALLDRKLVISGARQLPEVKTSRSFHQVEIETGEFRVEFALSKPVDAKKVTAEYQNGIMQVELPYLPQQSVQVVSKDVKTKD